MLKEPNFYIAGTVYILIRVAINVSSSVLNFYIYNVLKIKGTPENPNTIEIALVPLVSYIIQLIFSAFFMKKITKRLKNRFLLILLAIIFLAAGYVPLLFLNEDKKIRWLIYPL